MDHFNEICSVLFICSLPPHCFPSRSVFCPFYRLFFIPLSFHTASEMKKCKLFFLLIKRMKAGICSALLIALDWKWMERHRFGNSWIIFFPCKITSGIRVQRDWFQWSPWLIHFSYAGAMFVLSPLVREKYHDNIVFWIKIGSGPVCVTHLKTETSFLITFDSIKWNQTFTF